MGLHVDIRKRLGTFHLAVQFDTDASPLALLGASGSGKSVTLRCIAGILEPDEGQISLNGRTFFDSAAHISLPPQQRNVGYLFQQYALFPHMTVRQNIAAAVRDRRSRQEAAARQLRLFQLEDVADLKPRQLSGGQQQRTALARILASEPQLLLLDEPFSALDSFLKRQLELELTELLARFPGPTVWVSHDRGEVFRSCQAVCVLEQGRSQPPCPTDQLFRRPATEAAARLSGCQNFTDALPQDGRICLSEWGLVLDCGQPPSGSRAGIRADALMPCASGDSNSFPCRVVRVIRDFNTVTVLLRPEGARPDASALYMDLPFATWQPLADREQLTVRIAPEDILLFHDM